MTSKEALERIKKSHFVAMALLIDGEKDEETEQALEIIAKSLEVLEIIKERKVNVYDLNRVFSAYKYNYFCVLEGYQELTEKQFNTLKEWLENDK